MKHYHRAIRREFVLSPGVIAAFDRLSISTRSFGDCMNQRSAMGGSDN